MIKSKCPWETLLYSWAPSTRSRWIWLNFWAVAWCWKYSSIILSLFIKLFRENKLVKSFNLLLLHIKSINPIQKYLLFYEYFSSNFCFPWVLECTQLLWNVLNTKIIKICHTNTIHYEAIEQVLIDLYSSRFIPYAPSFTLGKIFHE